MIRYIKTVDSKPIVTDDNENLIRDLSARSLKEDDFRYVDIIICPKEFVMRPDLISKLKMGNHNNLEILLKGNEISNPFSIDEGDILLIPDPINSDSKFETASISSNPAAEIRKQYIDPKKASIVNTGDTYEEYSEREKTSLPPNYSKTGDKELAFVNGKIILGPDVSKTSSKESDIPLTKINFIEKMKKLNM